MNHESDDDAAVSTHPEKITASAGADAGAVKTDRVNQAKQDDIRAACVDVDIPELQRLAESPGGFLTDGLRRLAWPILLGLPVLSTNDEPLSASEHGDDTHDDNDYGGWKELPRHREEDQVQLDVNRSFVYYPTNLSESALSRRRAQLSALICSVLRAHPYLCYFQGYHDICQVLLLVLRPTTTATECLARLSLLRIRDFMLPNLGPTTAQLRLLPDLLERVADPALRRHRIAALDPFYALAGTLTMYSHNIEGYRDIARLFDALLAREPVFSVYLFAQIILDRRDELLAVAADDEDGCSDMLHVVLARVPAEMDIDGLVRRAAAVFKQHPPETLPAWRRISPASALKTARDHPRRAAAQSLADGEAFFDRQARELRWLDRRNALLKVAWAYRRPARAVGVAVAVGLVAFYMRRNPALINHVLSFLAR